MDATKGRETPATRKQSSALCMAIATADPQRQNRKTVAQEVSIAFCQAQALGYGLVANREQDCEAGAVADL